MTESNSPSSILDLFTSLSDFPFEHGIWYDYQKPLGSIIIHFRFTSQSILCSLCRKPNKPDQDPCETLQISFWAESPHIYDYCSECLKKKGIPRVPFTGQSSTK